MRGIIDRIALVGPLPPPFGGMANQTKQLASKLVAEGVEVELIQTNVPYKPAWVGKVPFIRAGFRLIPYLYTLWRAAGHQRLFHIMANSGWSWHLFAAPAVWIASFRRCAIVVNYRGGEADSFFSRSFRFVAPTLRRAHLVIVPSRYLQEIFEKYGIKAEVVPNHVNLERFSPQERLCGGNWPNLIICRNLEPIYGISVALQAFAQIRKRFPHARLLIAGSGSQRVELESLARELGLAESVEFTGQLSSEEMVDFYHKGDLMLNPSNVDNSPNSLLESMAAGVPIITTDAGGIPYLVEHFKTAMLVPVGNPDAMAETAIYLLERPEVMASLRASGLAKVRNHCWQSVREKLFVSYCHALDRQSQLIDCFEKLN